MEDALSENTADAADPRLRGGPEGAAGLIPPPSRFRVAPSAAAPPVDWHAELAGAWRKPLELLERLGLADLAGALLPAKADQFPLLVPDSYVARMRAGDPDDPLLRQVLPLAAEQLPVTGFEIDPVGDLASRRAPGLLHKYTGRALLILTGACAIHCRYCFRRHYEYSAEPHSLSQWQPALDELQRARDVHEIILSGGDPLTLKDQRLAQLCRELERIPHLRRLRIHTRLPIVIPSRVTDSLLDLLTELRLQVWFVIHANHANELTGDCRTAVERIISRGLSVLNQAVLLHGVNDSVDQLVELSERLIELRVIPYYLHQLDRVRGAAHFEVPVERGLELMRGLRARLPGYAVPEYVAEIPGEASKTRLI